ncbi:LD-carboxypeptidase [Ideonella livida]|uniref:LD-carboxypeptidase n=1 Tax=Ideonella livida TaxID=2707176 RepID=A0A7C9TK60_9BURK|nr:LD-carboxypeptidase [Ideonella livida]NDY90106.1 LD-carboxypeptidase [Ideonella livida]
MNAPARAASSVPPAHDAVPEVAGPQVAAHDDAHHDRPAVSDAPLRLTVFSPSGVVAQAAPLRRAVKRLKALGFEVALDPSALARRQRFAGTDDDRLEALHRVAAQAPDVALASRGGYGLTRLLDRLDWPLLARSVAQGTRWVGYSDVTALQLGLLAHTGATSWAGPMAVDDFGRDTLDEVTPDCFREAMTGELEAVGFRTEAGFAGLEAEGLLWGGNLSMVASLLSTPHWPQVQGGLLFLEDVAEHPYRVERLLLQLHQAGVLHQQRAILLGAFSAWRPSPLDRGYNLKTVVSHLRSVCPTPILTGLPFGHVDTKICLPVGRVVSLQVQARDVLLSW